MKILLLIPNLGRGGAQKVFHQHEKIFATDHTVVSCVFNLDGAFAHEKNSQLVSLDVPAGKNVIQKAVFFLKRVNRLKSLKKSLNIDVTISHLEGADYVNVLSRAGDKVVLWVHGTKKHDHDIKGPLGWFRRKIMLPFLYRRADRVVCVSEGIRDELSGYLGGIAVVRNGIDLEAARRSTQPLPSEWKGVFSDNFVIVTHCRLAPQKNIRALVKIISNMKDKPRVKWVIAGDGEERESLLKLCDELNIPVGKTVHFAGHQANPFPLLAAAQLYVLTSLWEGFPLSLCEAIACGLPVVAADCFTGPREILAPEIKAPVTKPTEGTYGILMPMVPEHRDDSIKLWSDYLSSLIDNTSLLQSYRDKASVSAERFSMNRLESETLEQLSAVQR